jgi:hypothetical protein
MFIEFHASRFSRRDITSKVQSRSATVTSILP